MKLFYKRLDLTELEYDNLIKYVDFDKLKKGGNNVFNS